MINHIKKQRKNLIGASLLFAAITFFIFTMDDPKVIWASLIKVNLKWFGLAIACLVLSWFYQIIMLKYMIAKIIKIPYSMLAVIDLYFTGKFFDGITPAATGGQIVQAVKLAKGGGDVERTSLAFGLRFIVFQLSLIAFSVILAIWNFNFFYSHNPKSMLMFGIGVGLNVALVVIIILFFKKPNVMNDKLNKISNFLKKYKLIKKTKNYSKTINNFSASLQLGLKNYKILIILSLLNVLFLISYHMIVYYVFNSLGLAADFWLVISASAIIWFVSILSPLPGAAIGTEGAFYVLMSTLYGDQEIAILSALILWRFLSFYLPMILGVFFVLVETKTTPETKEKK